MAAGASTSQSSLSKWHSFFGNLWQETAIVFLAALQLSWLVPWHSLLSSKMGGSTTLQGYLVFGVVLAAAVLVTRALRILDANPAATRAILLGLLGLGILFTAKLLAAGPGSPHPPTELATLFPDIYINVVAVILAWRGGIALGQEYLGMTRVAKRVGGGVWILFFYAVISAAYGGTWRAVDIGLFLFSAFSAMGVMRVVTQRELRGAPPFRFGRAWLGAVLTSIAVTSIFALSIGSLMEGPFGVVLFGITKIILIVIIAISIFPVLLGYMLVREPIENLILLFREYLIANAGEPDIRREGLDALDKMLQETSAELVDLSQVMGGIKSVFLWGGAVLMILLAVRKLGKFRNRLVFRREGQLEYGDVSLKDALLAAFAEHVDKLRARMRSGRWRYVDRVRMEARIRYIYASLLDRCDDLEIPRHEAQTPLEFLGILRRAFPALGDDLGVITHAFIQVRYGELEASREQLQAVTAAWERAQEGMRSE